MWSIALLVLILLRITIAQSPPAAYPQCDDPQLRNGLAPCQQFVNNATECAKLCYQDLLICEPELTKEGKILCTRETLLPPYIGTLWTHYQKLDAHLKSKLSASTSPIIYSPSDPHGEKPALIVYVEPITARIVEVNEKEQTIGVMLILKLSWVDYRLKWNPSEFGNIKSFLVTRDSIWRPPFFPLNTISFSNDDPMKPNVEVQHTGKVMDTTIWNFRQSVQMKFDDFPYDRQTFYIQLAKKDRLKLFGPQYILTETESETEWRIIEDFEKVPSGFPVDLAYKVVIKRFPYFWSRLIIVPCFILGFLVIAALTLGADTNTIEGLVNIGLAASVSSAVVVSAMTDHFPKTEKVPSIATFVQNQFIIIVTVLITLSIRKVVMSKINAAIEKWQKTENNEELSAMEKTWIFVVKVLKHRLFLFFIFGIAYAVCFAFVVKHIDLNFEQKKRKIITGNEHIASLIRRGN